MEEGDNDNEVKLIPSGGGAPEHNVQTSKLICSHSFTHVGTHTHSVTVFFSHSGENVAIKSNFYIVKTY